MADYSLQLLVLVLVWRWWAQRLVLLKSWKQKSCVVLLACTKKSQHWKNATLYTFYCVKLCLNRTHCSKIQSSEYICFVELWIACQRKVPELNHIVIKKNKCFVSQTGLVSIYLTLSFVCLFQSWFHWYVYYKPARIIQKCHRFQCFSGTAVNFSLFQFHLSASLYLLSLHLFMCFSICLDFVICLYLCLSVYIHLSISPSVSLAFCVSPCLSLSWSLSLYLHLSMSISLSVSIAFCPSTCLFHGLSLYLSVCIIYLPVFLSASQSL